MTRSLDERFAEVERLVAELRRDVAAAQIAERPRGKGPDLHAAAEQWIRGLGWDETFDESMIEEELSIIERRLHSELGPDERDRLVELWRQLRSERFPAAA
jgi:hypothetical protein